MKYWLLDFSQEITNDDDVPLHPGLKPRQPSPVARSKRKERQSFRLAVGLLVTCAGIVGIIMCYRNHSKWPKKLFPSLLMIGWGIFWLVLHIPLFQISTTRISSLLDIYRDGKSDVIEGVICVKHEQPASGHTKGDVITIGEKEFEVNHFLVTPGYKTTISHGGVLRQGVYARLHYHDEIILKVEIKTGQPGAAANSHP